jgi:uncharacterized membrane protein YphA (DoxX/SURF4 family)
MKLLVTISRILVGSLFIVSGLIKANDSLGFAYKLEEYFQPDVLGWMSWMEPYALPLAIFICIAEVVLGLAVLLGGKPKLTSWLMLLMILFFTWLTYYTATCDPLGAKPCVTECGCFGNAIPLTPWQSFTKDIVLLFFILIIFFNKSKFTLNTWKEDFFILPISISLVALFAAVYLDWFFPVIFTLGVFAIALAVKYFLKGNTGEWAIAGVAAVCSTFFALHTYNHLPMKDYRPYAIGKNIKEQMKSAEELGLRPTRYATLYTMKNKATGEQKKINSKEYTEQKIGNDPNWEITETGDKPIVLEKGYEPAIADFSVTMSDGTEVGEVMLNMQGYSFWFVCHSLEKTDVSRMETINKMANDAMAEKIPFMGITSASADAIKDFRHLHQNMFDFLIADQIVLKTIVRSNPGLVLLKNGTIIMQWHNNDIPDYASIKKDFMK